MNLCDELRPKFLKLPNLVNTPQNGIVNVGYTFTLNRNITYIVGAGYYIDFNNILTFLCHY